MEQYDFSADWDLFYDGLDSFLKDDQSFKREYNSICKKAKMVEDADAFDAACYYYMAAILSYYYYEDLSNSDSDDSQPDASWVVELGNRAIQNAIDLDDDDEFLVLSLVFELLVLKQNNEDVHFLFRELQAIKDDCPEIETLDNTLIKTEVLQQWFELAYNDIIIDILLDWEEQGDLDMEELGMKADFAREMIDSSTEAVQEMGYGCLCDALFEMGDYAEAERYAIKGKNLRGDLTEYDDTEDYFWGICYCVHVKCQERIGKTNYAMKLIEHGAELGIPWCEDELDRLA